MIAFSVLGAGLAAGGALLAEIVRFKQANDRLAADMQKRELAGTNALQHRKVRYPRLYLLSFALYTVAAGAVAGFIGNGVPWEVDVYMGLSLPSFISQVVRVAEPILPGRTITGPASSTQDSAGASSATIDDISVHSKERTFWQVRKGVFRPRDSFYSYLAA